MPAVKPKLALQKKPKPSPVPIVEEVDTGEAVEELTEERVMTLEERAANVEAALASSLDRIDQLDAEIATKISSAVNSAKPALMEWLNLKLEQRETSLFYQIVDYFGQCPEWEMKKVLEGEKSKTNGEDLFAASFKDGWRFLGNFTHPSDPANRYTLFCRPKGGPISDEEYMKSYERFKERRDRQIEEKKQETSAAKEEQTNKPQVSAPKLALKKPIPAKKTPLVKSAKK